MRKKFLLHTCAQRCGRYVVVPNRSECVWAFIFSGLPCCSSLALEVDTRCASTQLSAMLVDSFSRSWLVYSRSIASSTYATLSLLMTLLLSESYHLCIVSQRLTVRTCAHIVTSLCQSQVSRASMPHAPAPRQTARCFYVWKKITPGPSLENFDKR